MPLLTTSDYLGPSEMDQLAWITAGLGPVHSGAVYAQKEFCESLFLMETVVFPEEDM